MQSGEHATRIANSIGIIAAISKEGLIWSSILRDNSSRPCTSCA